MSLFDRITEGAREKALLAELRSGAITPENLEKRCPPFFFKIQIQTVSTCNGRCITCPYPEVSRRLPQGRMEEKVFRAVVDQVKGRGVERAGLFLMNEPLLDTRLERFVTLLKSEEPGTRALIFTNGLLLTEARSRSLAQAGLDEVNVSVNGFDRAAHNRVMPGIDYDRVMENLRALARLKRSGLLGRMEVKVVGLQLPGTEEGVEAFRRETELPVYLKPVTNRAGLVDADRLEGAAAKGRKGGFRPCQRPFVKAYVLFNGDMVLCNCDWMRTTVIGNVMDQPLDVLWKSGKLMAVRRAQLAAAFPPGLPCRSCDYPFRIDR